jgi:hypothetical protein
MGNLLCEPEQRYQMECRTESDTEGEGVACYAFCIEPGGNRITADIQLTLISLAAIFTPFVLGTLLILIPIIRKFVAEVKR